MKNPEEIARRITEKIAQSAFDFFKDKKFRRLIDFNSLEQVEQDRIFNEIIASGLALGILMFRTASELTKEERSDFFNELQVELTSCYGNRLKEMGAEEKFAEMWKELIFMRCKEYERDYTKHKKLLPNPNESNPWITVVAIGGYDHIKRGQGSPDDPLYLIFLKWIKSAAITISKSAL